MNNGKHVDLVRRDAVDDPKGALDNLTDLGEPEFRDFTPRHGEISNLLGAAGQPIDKAQSIFGRIPCNVGVDGPQMVTRRIRPMDFHFSKPNCARSVSTLVVRPAWLSARPDSMAWRT